MHPCNQDVHHYSRTLWFHISISGWLYGLFLQNGILQCLEKILEGVLLDFLNLLAEIHQHHAVHLNCSQWREKGLVMLAPGYFSFSTLDSLNYVKHRYDFLRP